MIPGFSGYTIALLLIPQGVANNWKNFEQPLSNGSGLAVETCEARVGFFFEREYSRDTKV